MESNSNLQIKTMLNDTMENMVENVLPESVINERVPDIFFGEVDINDRHIEIECDNYGTDAYYTDSETDNETDETIEFIKSFITYKKLQDICLTEMEYEFSFLR